MEALCKSGSLFEVAVPDYKQLKACHKEVRLLKELWDMIVMVSRPASPPERAPCWGDAAPPLSRAPEGAPKDPGWVSRSAFLLSAGLPAHLRHRLFR